MPIRSVPDRTKRLIEAFDELCQAGWWPPRDLASDPDYPRYVHIIRPQDPEDDYYRELVRRALNPQASESPDGDDEVDKDEILLRPDGPDDRLAKGVAVYQIGNAILQIVEGQTPTAASVLGRVGVVDLICRKLEKHLADKDILEHF